MFKKGIVLFFTLFLLLFTWASTKQHLHIELSYTEIDEGVGFEKIKVDTTTLKKAISFLGKDYKRYNGKKPVSDRKPIPLSSIIYASKGIELRSWGKGEIIESIIFSKPFIGKTKKGIILNESTAEDVLKLYGLPEVRDRRGKKENTHRMLDYFIGIPKEGGPFICCDSIYSYGVEGIDFVIESDTFFITYGDTAITDYVDKIKNNRIKQIVVYGKYE